MRNTRLPIALVILATALAAAVACTDRLPAEDRRILDAVPAAKLSVENLSHDYQADAKAADKRYWGKAIEISGVVSSMRDQATGAALLFNDKNGALIVEADLLDDQAKAVLASTANSRRTILRCYCGGAAGGHVVLKSCIAPQR